jgi:hypothetical protein
MQRRVLILLPAAFFLALGAARSQINALRYQSAFMRVELAQDQPAFVVLSVDSLGKSKLSVNALRPPAKPEMKYELHHFGSNYEYRPSGTPTQTPPIWTFEFSARQIHLHSHFAVGNPPPSFVLNFNSHLNHATLLGNINEDRNIPLPALLHLPDLGTFRITSSKGTGARI